MIGERTENFGIPRPLRGLLPHTMGTTDARTRIRQRIRRLLEDRGKTNREFAKYLGHGDQWASNLLAGRFGLSLDELDRVAAFLRVPPGEIVRVSEEPWELSPSEMRVVRALRMLPPPVREQLVLMADYLVGVTPDEVEVLKKLRALDEAELAKVDHFLDVTLLRLDRERAPRATADPAPSSVKRDGPPPRTGTRSKR